ncbi:MAG: ABC transporter permease [Desulfovibrio sp.]|jgi:putative ABC transport system permease protein|nr:ABC transporter permease [Desulfovibrio sp.]
MPEALGGPPKRALVLSLCLADLRHESMLTICMVMAVAAVLGPLLTLFGLKYGTVETLRDRLIRDPRNCEVRPAGSHAFTAQWFEDTAKRPDVAFIVPTTRQLSAAVEISLAGAPGKSVSLEALPTAPGDPLILENGARVPEDGQTLLSASAAETLGAAVGDTLTLTVRRVKNSGFQSAQTEILVIGILPVRAGAGRSLFITLPLLENIENFKDGLAVPALRWPGDLPRAYPLFHALLAVLPKSPGPELLYKLTNNTGFAGRTMLTRNEAATVAGLEMPDAETYILLSAKGSPAGVHNIEAIRNILAGQKAALYLPAPEAFLTLRDDGGRAIGVFRVRAAAPFDSVAGTGLQNAFPWKDDLTLKTSSAVQWLKVLVPAGLLHEGGMEATGEVAVGGNAVRFPVQLIPSDDVESGTVKAPLRFLGMLGLLQTRPLFMDKDSREFLLSKRGYAGFRLYASSLENVAGLKRSFEEQGMQVHTEAERIDDVMRLDKYLTLIFWLIAAGSLAGGTACLASNIYAGIERKRRELAVLRLLGLARAAFLRFPLYTASFYALCGFYTALCFFYGMSFVINTVFAGHLQGEESLCRLAWRHALAALALTVGIAVISGSIAAIRAAAVDPAQALRDE